MKSNPFVQMAPEVEVPRAWQVKFGLARQMKGHQRDGWFPNHEGPPQESEPHARRFLRWIVAVTVAVLILVLFVAREIIHSREKYRLGMEVARAEAQRRDAQKSQRIEEVWRAYLLAELHSKNMSSREGQRLNGRSLVSFQWR